MPVKVFMSRSLAAYPGSGSAETIEDADLPAVAALMVDGYRDTTDYEGEGVADALEELLATAADAPLRDAWLQLRGLDGAPLSAIICTRWHGLPLVSYVFTAPAHKRSGCAGRLLEAAAAALSARGETQLALFVTEGNPARSLYERHGFVAGDA